MADEKGVKVRRRGREKQRQMGTNMDSSQGPGHHSAQIGRTKPWAALPAGPSVAFASR